MLTVPAWLFAALLVAPMAAIWYVQARLLPYRRQPHDWLLVLSYRGLRPDRYTDAGQPWLHRLWFLFILTIPWIALVAVVLRPR